MLAIASGGRVVEVYRNGQPFFCEHADEDTVELPAIIRDLGVRSQVCAPLEIAGARRGVLTVVSQTPAYFKASDFDLVVLVASWVSALAHRAELIQQRRDEDARKDRIVVAEEIITVLAHDIRNHLQPLSGRLQLLQLRIVQNEAIEPKLLDPALSAVRRLERMTRDLLDLARLEQGLFDLQLAPVDVCELVAECAATCSTPRTAIEVEGPERLVAVVDKNRLHQALENVVINGVRDSPAGSPLRITVKQTEDTRAAQIVIADDGAGIRPELLPHLFERFVTGRGSRASGSACTWPSASLALMAGRCESNQA